MIDGKEDLKRVTRLLLRDVGATVGDEHRDYVLWRAAEVRELGIEYYGAKLVEDVQQYLHDTFVDTTWPACPRHPNHPLWCQDAVWWRCERDGVAITPLGELGALEASE